MYKPKKILNNPDNLRQEIMEGLMYLNMGNLQSLPEHCAVYRENIDCQQVVIISGGGSGHEPTFAGFVGRGGIDGCALGEVFASPSPDQIIEVSQKIHQGAGILFLYGNYSGDSMNFDIASEILTEQGIICRTVKATDDIASSPLNEIAQRRGVAGLMFLYKIAGAAAQYQHYDLARLQQLLIKANHNTRTIGVALNGCALPQSDSFNFTLADDEVEIGIGIHGERGLYRSKLPTCDRLVEIMLDKLLKDLPFNPGDRVCVSINNLGSLSNSELFIVSRKAGKILAENNITTHDVVNGHFCTSLEMSGFSISLLRLDDELQALYDMPLTTIGWRK